MRLDHLLSRELDVRASVRTRVRVTTYTCGWRSRNVDTDLEVGFGLACCLVLRDRDGPPGATVHRRRPLRTSRRTLKTAQLAEYRVIYSVSLRSRNEVESDHRQDSKGRWWMPWHQEPKKDVDGCDKSR